MTILRFSPGRMLVLGHEVDDEAAHGHGEDSLARQPTAKGADHDHGKQQVVAAGDQVRHHTGHVTQRGNHQGCLVTVPDTGIVGSGQRYSC